MVCGYSVLIRKHAVRVTVMVMSMVSTDFDGAVFGVVQLQGRDGKVSQCKSQWFRCSYVLQCSVAYSGTTSEMCAQVWCHRCQWGHGHVTITCVHQCVMVWKPVCVSGCAWSSGRRVSSGLASRARCLGGEATYSGVASVVVSV